MKTKDGDTIDFGLHDWYDYVQKAATRTIPGVEVFGDRASLTNEDDWAGGSFAFAAKAAISGWPEGAQEIDAELDKLPPESPLIDWLLDVHGYRPCIEAYMAGDPACMWHQSEDAGSKRRVVLAAPFMIMARTPHAFMQRYAKAIAIVTRAIEAKGIDVAVVGLGIAYSNRGGSESRFRIGVTVRNFGEYLDLGKVAFAFHPTFFRRLGFAWAELSKEAAPVWGSHGYGLHPPGDKALEIREDDVRALMGEVDVPVVALPRAGNLSGRESVDELVTMFLNWSGMPDAEQKTFWRIAP